MHRFLIDNRAELIARCKRKVALRPRRAATTQQLEHGIPLFIDQLAQTLEAEEVGQEAVGIGAGAACCVHVHDPAQIGLSAAVHGRELQQLGFTVDQVVHDYGDLSQAIIDLAFARQVPFEAEEYRTLSRCLDNAIAGAVTEFGRLREASIASEHVAAANERLGFLVHELRNALGTATLAVSALELGNMPIAGATGAVLKRSLHALKTLIDRSLSDVREGAAQPQVFPVAALIADASEMVQLQPAAARCIFAVAAVDPTLAIRGDRGLLLAAVVNLVQNAFKFTRAGTGVSLAAHASLHHVVIEVSDHCGGLPPGSAEEMFTPFRQRSDDRSGLGLGLSIARQGIEADAGTLAVRDVPGIGCVFTIRLPLHPL